MFHTKEFKEAKLLYISINNHNTQTEKGKFIYVQGLTLHSKELLLKCDLS